MKKNPAVEASSLSVGQDIIPFVCTAWSIITVDTRVLIWAFLETDKSLFD